MRLQQSQVDLPEADTSASFGFAADLAAQQLRAARQRGWVAWDIETSGLDWRSDKIGLCQVDVGGTEPVLVRASWMGRPTNLARLLEDQAVVKIFHHAMFDLRFMCHHWHAFAANVACTKIAGKLLEPGRQEGITLSYLLRRYLGRELEKSDAARKSNWLSPELSAAQVNYARDDVRFLKPLLDAMLAELDQAGRLDLARRTFHHVPTQVELEVGGFGNVYGY